MIILKSKKCKKNFKEILNNYNFIVNPPCLHCPHCHSTNFIKWGYYYRNCFFVDNNDIVFKAVKIQRVKCKDCSHTHALLPELIVPYKQFLLDVILLSINNDKITYSYAISYDTITNWKWQFNKFLPYLNTIYNNCKNLIDTIINSIFDAYELFYDRCNKILMMTHKGIFNMAYF